MRKIHINLSIFIAACVLMSVTTQDKFLSFTRSIETFAAVLNELDKNYLAGVDIDSISDHGISTLTENLDGYTCIITSNVNTYKSKFDTELYYGIGVEIEDRHGRKYFSRIYRNTPAHKAGFQPGDEIIKINNVDVAQKSSLEVLNMIKANSNSNSNSFITIHIQRFGTKDQKVILVSREKSKPFSILYFTNIVNDTAYVKIQDFAAGLANELRNILLSLKSLGAVKLILDLRGNPGGNIDEAVQLLEQFLYPDTLIVRSSGKNVESNKEYRAASDTFDVNTPIVILVDDQTASAAEIVAGVMQDLDRGVVIGRPTFGKGTIQTIKDLPYGNKIKITTAKYILPSGRTISSFINSNSAKSYKSKQFKTKSGRMLYEQQGITPDIIIPDFKLSQISLDIINLGYLENFAVYFKSKNKEIARPDSFSLSNSQYQDFVNWMGASNVLLSFERDAVIFISNAQVNGYGEVIKKQLSNLQSQMIRARQARLQQLKKELKPLLEMAIVEQYYMYEGALEVSFVNDAFLQKAIALLHNGDEYGKMFVVKQ